MAKFYLIQNQTLVPATLITPARVNPPRHNKAPLPVETIVEDPDVLLKPQKTNNQPRRRERLAHLTAEEKLNRRKMKNREAAQNARDRKKEQGKQMEDVIRQLAAENKKLRNENAKLKAQVARLTGPRSSYSSASTELDLPGSPDSAYASSSTSALSPVSSTNSSTGYQPVVYYDKGQNQASLPDSHYSLSAGQSPEPTHPIVPSVESAALRMSLPRNRTIGRFDSRRWPATRRWSWSRSRARSANTSRCTPMMLSTLVSLMNLAGSRSSAPPTLTSSPVPATRAVRVTSPRRVLRPTPALKPATSQSKSSRLQALSSRPTLKRKASRTCRPLTIWSKATSSTSSAPNWEFTPPRKRPPPI